MADVGALELLRTAQAAIVAKLTADATLIARETVIESSRVADLPDSRGSELVIVQAPAIDSGELVQEQPEYYRYPATLFVTALVDAADAKPGATTLADPATAVLEALDPLVELLEPRIHAAFRDLRNPAVQAVVAAQLAGYHFDGYRTTVDTAGNRLRAVGTFRFILDLNVPTYLDPVLDDLTTGEIDYELRNPDGTASPDPPHAEDLVTV